jgi:hypothetical protein
MHRKLTLTIFVVNRIELKNGCVVWWLKIDAGECERGTNFVAILGVRKASSRVDEHRLALVKTHFF